MWREILIWTRGVLVLLKIGLLCFVLMPWALLVLMFPKAERIERTFGKISWKGMRWFIHHINGAKLEIKGKLIGEDKPCVFVVASHASLLDVPVVMSLRPKVAVMAKEYVTHNPVYGVTARALGVFSVAEGYEQITERVREKIENGYSVAVFPEGRRTYDGEIQRFHKGAFYVAEKLGLAIQPIFIYGTFDVFNRNEFKLYSHPIYVEIMEPIEKDDDGFGKDYRSRAKALEQLFRKKKEEIIWKEKS